MRTIAADAYKLTLPAGTHFSKTFYDFPNGVDGTPRNLSSYSAAAQVRDRPGGTLLVAFTVTLGGATGTITLAADIPDRPLTRAVWDLKMTDPNGKVTRPLSGPAIIAPPQVTT